ncbi:MAG TPA: UDP-3-O-(3-hydroxymyristoyl)glucosamine N-acyltransferase [Myxococcota bacterium]|jgi:UDP-3-O-[3-hydroxymyristoyl] glucosamine N-acyltransferase|nr:UDP-3-O-(3-hydroxymyristoyl)glucosamine N-acyltransferase [Myxococcota bacterium]
MRLGEIAERLGREVVGDGDLRIAGVAALDLAGPADLSFVRSLRWAKGIDASRAGALIVPSGVDAKGRPSIPSPNPGLDFARAVALLVPGPRPPPGIDPRAHVAGDAVVDATACLGPGVLVGAGCRIGPRSVLWGNVTLYPDASVGADCAIHAGVVLREGTRVGDRVVIQPNAVLGGDGFGFALNERGEPEKIPQVGRVVVEDDVEIGAGTTIDRAALGETRIGRGTKIDNLVQIAHNCDVGENVVIVAQAGLAGSTVVEDGAMLMARAASAGHLRIGERAFVGAAASLHRDVRPGGRVWGTPQMEERLFHRVVAAMTRLPDALRRLRAVEKKLGLRGRDAAATDVPLPDVGEAE